MKSIILVLVGIAVMLGGCKQSPVTIRITQSPDGLSVGAFPVSIDLSELRPGTKMMITSPNRRTGDISLFGAKVKIIEVHKKLLVVRVLSCPNADSNVGEDERIYQDYFDFEIYQ